MIRLIVVSDYRELGSACAAIVQDQIGWNAGSVLGLPTGSTPIGLYEAVVRAEQRGDVDLRSATVFNLDEYLDLPAGHPSTFGAFMDEHLFGRLRSPPARRFIPSSHPPDVEAECTLYERRIRDVGGLDLTLLGLGANGHIAFNEPGTGWGTWTHVATLAPETRAQQASRGIEELPRRAITMGIRTIMSSRRTTLMVSGLEKAGILSRALTEPPNPGLPASVLQLHPDCLVIADEAAASCLRRSLCRTGPLRLGIEEVSPAGGARLSGSGSPMGSRSEETRRGGEPSHPSDGLQSRSSRAFGDGAGGRR